MFNYEHFEIQTKVKVEMFSSCLYTYLPQHFLLFYEVEACFKISNFLD